MPAALGAQPDLVAMVLDLRFVPQCRLDLGSETSRLFACFQGSAHKVVWRHLVSLPGPLSDPTPRPHTCPRLPRGTKGVTGADTPTPGAESRPPSPNCVHTLHVVHARGEASVLAHSYLTLCNPMDCSSPDSSVHGIFFRQEYRSGLLFPPPGDFSDPGIEPTPLASPALTGGFCTTARPGKAKSTQTQEIVQ